ncbi:MAG: hypothetical protein AAF682_16870 [Planctomycetota bacterium]
MKTRIGQRCLQLLGVFGALVTASQADVLTVEMDGSGPGYNTIQEAIDAAASGDTILIKQPFTWFAEDLTIDGKSLELVRDGDFTLLNLGRLRIVDLAADQWVRVQGIELSSLVDPFGLEVRDCLGVVWIEDCEVFPQLDVIDSAAVVLVGCTAAIDGSSTAGLRSVRSTVHALDSDIGDVGFFGIVSSDAVAPSGALVDGGVLYAQRCRIEGAKGEQAGGLPCSAGGDGGIGLEVVGDGPVVRLLETTPEGGGGGASLCGPVGVPGADVAAPDGAVETYPGHGYSLSSNSPLREGQTLTLTGTGPPGDLLFLAYASTPSALLVEPWKGTVLGAFTLAPISLGAIGAGGEHRALHDRERAGSRGGEPLALLPGGRDQPHRGGGPGCRRGGHAARQLALGSGLSAGRELRACRHKLQVGVMPRSRRRTVPWTVARPRVPRRPTVAAELRSSRPRTTMDRRMCLATLATAAASTATLSTASVPSVLSVDGTTLQAEHR